MATVTVWEARDLVDTTALSFGISGAAAAVVTSNISGAMKIIETLLNQRFARFIGRKDAPWASKREVRFC